MKHTLYAPESFWVASQEERDVICNGCGASDAKFDFVPDTVYGLDISMACHIHDWMYYHAEATDEAKQEADRVLSNNLFRLVENKGGCLKRLRRRRIWKYYKAVQVFGGSAFWDGKNKGINGFEIEPVDFIKE